MIKIVTIIGARPQFIKAAAVSRAIAKKNETLEGPDRIQEIIIHTGQHYDSNMSAIFFDELHIPKPDFNLNIGSGFHGDQTGRMLAEIEKVLLEEKPDIVLTYGDTNSTMAGALAAVKMHIPVAHVEAGLRSFNRRMPEEINRLVTDEVSSMLFCPTITAMDNLAKEGIRLAETCFIDINRQAAYLVGDVMFDSILFNADLAKEKSATLLELNLNPGQYILATIHRAENTDDPDRLAAIFSTFNRIAGVGEKMILPIHPRTRKHLSQLNFALHPNLKVTDPVGYLDMVNLLQNACAVFTDSGGVQKEAFFLKVPCITLRPETEWVETVAAGWNILCSADTIMIMAAWQKAKTSGNRNIPFSQAEEISPDNLYGDGHASEKILDIIHTGCLNS